MVGRSTSAKSAGQAPHQPIGQHSPQLIERQQYHSLVVVVVVLVAPLLVVLLPLVVLVQKGWPLVVSSTLVQREDHRPRNGCAVCAL
jgi:hypothetical protein